MHDYNNYGVSDKEDLIIMETDEENISNGANTAIPAIVVDYCNSSRFVFHSTVNGMVI